MTSNRKPSVELVNELPSTAEIDLAVASCMENACDMGLREDAEDDGEAFWAEVYGQVLGQLGL